MKKYLKQVYFEETSEDAIDVLVDLLYSEDIVSTAQKLRKEFEQAKVHDEAEYGDDIYENSNDG